MFMNQNQTNCDGGGNMIAVTGGSIMDSNQSQPQSLNSINGQQTQQHLLQQHQQTQSSLNQQQQQQQQQQQKQQQQQSHQQQSTNTKGVRKKPFVRIVEQPASKGLRFRYECEGRSAGSIPGVNSTPDNKTFPTIEVVGYKGRAVVVVSCVTKDAPYRPHPHNLVGKEGCKKGVCTIEINSETMRAVFSNLGIQCVKKKDISAALKAREEIRVDPFKTASTYKNQTSNIDLNAVRLCFQVFLEGEQKGRFTQPIAPVVSDPIYDKKAMSDLVICRLCSCSSTVAGGATIILLCEKVSKDDISVRFYQEKNGRETWTAFGEFQQTDVHKQTAITFKTPRYHTMEIDKPESVYIQLYRPSDGATSESLQFDYVPLESGMRTFWAMRRNLKRKPDIDIFQEILSLNNEIISENNNKILSELPKSDTIITLDTPSSTTERSDCFNLNVTSPSLSSSSSSSIQQTIQPINHDTDESIKRQNETEIDHIVNEKVRELQIDFSPLKKFDQQDQQMDMSISTIDCQENNEKNQIDEKFLNNSEPHQLNPNDKITEWMKSSEFDRTDSLTTEPGESISSPTTCLTSIDIDINVDGDISNKTNSDEDKVLNDLLNQVAELDEIYTDHQMRRDTFRNTIINELNLIPDPLATETSMDIDESFDDTATYTSLQIAFKNPIKIPITDIMPPTPPPSQLSPEDEHYDAVEVMKSQPKVSETKIETQNSNNVLIEEEKLPPLPPKRLRKFDNVENCSIEANTNYNKTDYHSSHVSNTNDISRLRSHSQSQSQTQSPSQIIIMKTPNQSPPTKRLPSPPTSSNNSNNNNNSNTLTRQKKQGFFSKLFSRRKSKTDLNQTEITNMTKSTPSISTLTRKPSLPPGFRPPIVKPFPLTNTDADILRPAKSMQPLTSTTTSSSSTSILKNDHQSASMKKNSNLKNKFSKKEGKPVGRSVSSVSGKRPQLKSTPDVIHIPLKGESLINIPQQQQQEAYSNASTITLSNNFDRRTVSALQLADIPINDGNMELVAIADRQSLKNLCGGEYGVKLDPDVDLTEAEHFALYTSIPPQATVSEFDETSCYYAPVDAGEILTPDEIAKRLADANKIILTK